MRQTPNWKTDIDLINKCGSCKQYEPYIKKEVLTARGHCTLRKNTYRQRTESCLKYIEGKKYI